MAVPKLEPLTPNTTWSMPDGTLSSQGYNFLYSISLRLGGTGSTVPGYAELPNLLITNQLRVTGSLSITADNTSVVLTPGLFGSVTIFPSSIPGRIDNMIIGDTTPRAVTGTTVQATGAFGCNGKSPQTPYPCNTPSNYIGGPFGLSSGVDMGLLVATVRDIRLALIAAGIIS